MAKYLVETYYTCSFKVSHYLDDVNEKNLQNLEKNEDGKFEIPVSYTHLRAHET